MRASSLSKGLLLSLLIWRGLDGLWGSSAQAQNAAAGSLPAASSSPASSPSVVPKKSGLVSIDFSEPTDIQYIVGQVARWTGKNVLIDAQVKGKITIFAAQEVSKEEAYQAFLSSLNMLGLTTVETGRIIKIVRISDGMRGAPPTLVRDGHEAFGDQVVTHVRPLAYIGADRLRTILSRFVTPNALVAYPDSNTLLITDTGYNVRRILAIIALMDVKTQQPHMQMIPILHGSAKDMAEKVKDFIKVSTADRGNSSQYHHYTALSEERSNALILVGPPSGLRQFRDIVKSLDLPEPTGTTDRGHIHVRPLEYMEAKKLAITLSAITAGSRPQLASLPRRKDGSDDSPPKITAEDETNSLIISGSNKAYAAVNRVIRRLDVRRDQILIEADVLELVTNNQFTFGASHLGGYGKADGKGTKYITAWQAGAMAPLVLAASDAGKATPSSVQGKEVARALSDGLSIGVFAPQGVEVSGLGRVSPGALLKLLKADANTRILSSPYILTVDNEEASLAVGETIFFKTAMTNDQGVVAKSVAKENADFTLTVKPSVNASNYLSLKLGLEANSIAGLTSEGVPRLNKRKIAQVITIKDGQTAVVAGLNQRASRHAGQKIPILGDLPVVGALFRVAMEQSEQSQLAVFLTPHIVRGPADLARIYREKITDVHQIMESIYGPETKEDDFFAELPDIEDGIYHESAVDRRDQEQLRQRQQEAMRNWGYTEKLR